MFLGPLACKSLYLEVPLLGAFLKRAPAKGGTKSATKATSPTYKSGTASCPSSLPIRRKARYPNMEKMPQASASTAFVHLRPRDATRSEQPLFGKRDRAVVRHDDMVQQLYIDQRQRLL